MDSQTIQRRRWVILSVLIISLIAIVLDNTVLNIALKTIAEPRGGLGASQSQLEWAINSYTLVFAGLLFTFGVIGDRIGRRRMLIIGMAMFGLASLLSSYAQTPDQLIWARALMGLGGAAVMPQTLSIITNVFEPRERARAIGIWAAAVGMAIAIGPIVGGLLLDHFWWGSVFLINVPVTAVGVAAIILFVPESKSPAPGRIDYLGVLLSIVGLVLVVYGIIQGGDTGSWLRGDVLGPVAGGLAVLAVFGWHEARTAHPSLDVRLFRNPRLSSATAAIALVFFAMAGVYFFISFYLQNVRGFSPLHAGLLTIPIAAGQLLASPRSAALVRRFGARAVSSASLLLMAVAMAGYHLLGTTTPIWVLEVAFFVQAVAMGTIMPLATEAVMSVVPRDRGGAGSAITNVSRQVAVALGVAVLGSVLAQVYRNQLSPHLAGLPAGARGTATQSIAATQAVAQKLGPAGSHLLTAANDSFVQAMHVTSLISMIIAILGAIVMAVWMPGRTAVPAESSVPAESTGPADSSGPAESTGPAGDPVAVRVQRRDEVLVDG
ncbi:MAG TPA: DHA2 family efflux MFS transporter permease subunit [Streptosporangiaceae bacterium]|jgi:EmrB/QacA subfamily drug resistance transporter